MWRTRQPTLLLADVPRSWRYGCGIPMQHGHPLTEADGITPDRYATVAVSMVPTADEFTGVISRQVGVEREGSYQ